MLVTLNKCFVPTAKFSTSRFFTTFVNQQTKQLTVNSLFGSIVIDKARFRECHTSNFQPSKGIQSNISALKMKKKPVRKKRVLTNTDVIEPGFFRVRALATAEEYSLESLTEALKKQNLYITNKIYTAEHYLPHNVVHAIAKYEVEHEPRQIYFFREGTVVMWNVSELECSNVLQFLKDHEENAYSNNIVQAEVEMLAYTYTDPGKKSHMEKGNIYLTPNENYLDRYTFSNAISQSVKLGIWEASLNHFVDSIEFISEDLKNGRKIKMSRQKVLRKQGELFALRHLINLSSDLLDTPDFYWERDELENIYQQTCAYFSINKRTRVMNEKVNHCMELVELLSSHLSDRHHVRLEWMIIVLIMVEVAFETIHYIERYYVDEEDGQPPVNNVKNLNTI